MINRKVLAVAFFFIGNMLAVAFWRMALLADWTALPRFSPTGVALAPGSIMGLFIPPLALLSGLFCVALQGWLMQAPEGPKLERWRDYNAYMLAALGVLFGVLQGMMIFKSFAATSFLTGWDGFRGFLILWGVVLIAISNSAPKLPFMQARFALRRLDDGSGARYLRLVSTAGVLFGLVFILSAFLAPQVMLFPIVRAIAASMLLGTALVIFTLMRKQTHQGEP